MGGWSSIKAPMAAGRARGFRARADQTLKLRTEGWSWIAGGGIEVWISKRFALYADADFGRIRGDAVSENDDMEGEAHDNLLGLFGGFRVRIF